jgi:hypothetical protein
VSSTAVNHTDTLFKALSLVRFQPVENVTVMERDATNTGIMGISSLAFLLLAPMFYMAAGLNRKPGVVDAWIYGVKEPEDEIVRTKLIAAEAPGGGGIGGHLDSHFSITDERGLNKLRDEIAGHAARAYAMLQPHLGAVA